ncbi:MAG TPA: NADH:flavin oxidoreductase/NADH oxidase [Myxococcales bacterium]|jgi:2,4-dienoyl-CoA reductase-like NADH-dependent reductase (Old Yellow Enzyme family)|nr:NADH:flavin oxidoreductase/NADH oxidase [Myxococcales bacterium]
MLFDPLEIRGVALKNRIVVSPMCQYSSEDGFANEWHFVHLGSRAVGGAALVFTEASAVTPEGRISPQDLGIWKDEHVAELSRIARFVEAQGAVAGMQLAHAGRKASTQRPWEGNRVLGVQEGGFRPILAPSPAPFRPDDPTPQELDGQGIARIVRAFGEAAERALRAGFRVLEIHSAHGYLLHEFLSPLSNRRTDAYGGSFDNRIRALLEVVAAVRARWPERLPLWVRISATDWAEGGWDIEQSIELSRRLVREGVDLIDCSSGGLVPGVKIPLGPGYQTPFAERIRREAAVKTGAVGLIRSADQAAHIVRSGQADVVILARQLLRDPYWPLAAARQLGVQVRWPPQYERARD